MRSEQAIYLLPDINEYWVNNGGAVHLAAVAKGYASSAALRKIQSQVWALNQLAEDAAYD